MRLIGGAMAEHLARVGVTQNLSAYVLRDDCALHCVWVLARQVRQYYQAEHCPRRLCARRGSGGVLSPPLNYLNRIYCPVSLNFLNRIYCSVSVNFLFRPWLESSAFAETIRIKIDLDRFDDRARLRVLTWHFVFLSP